MSASCSVACRASVSVWRASRRISVKPHHAKEESHNFWKIAPSIRERVAPVWCRSARHYLQGQRCPGPFNCPPTSLPCMLCYAMHAMLCHVVLCHAVPPSMLRMLWQLRHKMTDLLDLLLVGAAVNGPGGPLVVKPVCDLIEPLLQAVPVSSQASKHPIKVVTGCLHLDLPLIQITQACSGNKP